jgi:hypoxanthine phosphoribosyltransferase
MTQTNARDLWVSWEQYHDLIEQLAVLLGQADFKFNHLVCLARGGLRIGDVLSRVFAVPLAILAC